ncbi:uncharacterized protein [Amphiura filiformis]|uniref:uncharacterized protein isoform X2 n=1 Tax=Amphiura filiformis TaxID=82378 RepID=UPI003B223255
MATTAFGSLPRRRAHTTGTAPPPPSRSRSETYIHVPQASFDDDIKYSDEGSVYEQIEIVGESSDTRFPWQRDVGIQCQKKFENAEVQVNLMDINTCPKCGSDLSSSEFAVNHHRIVESNGHNSNDTPPAKPPEIMFNGLSDADSNDDIATRTRTRERPLSDPGIDQFDNIPFLNSESETAFKMKVMKENLRLNLPTELLESKSFPLSPCPSPHKQVRRSPPKVNPVLQVEDTEDVDADDILPSYIPGPALSETPYQFSTSRKFSDPREFAARKLTDPREFATRKLSDPRGSIAFGSDFEFVERSSCSSNNTTLLGSHDSSSNSSLHVPSPELLQTRAPYPRGRMVSTNSEITDEEEEPTFKPSQSSRIRVRRGAVISQLPPSSSDVVANEEDSSPGSQDGMSRRASASSRSPSLQTPNFADSLFVNGEHRHSAVSDASMSLTTVAAGHFQDAIETSVISGFNGSSNSLTGTPDASDKKSSMTVMARFVKKFGKESDRSMIKDITEVFNNFKIRDQDELEFAAFKDKHWKELMSPQENGMEHLPVMHSPSELKRRDKVWELFRAECVYLIEHILVLKNVFQEPLRALQVENFLMYAEPSKLFANIDELYQVSAAFCRELVKLLLGLGKSKPVFAQTEAVVDAFKSFDSHLCPAYQRYCMNYSGALHYLEMLKRRDDFSEFLKLCEQDRRCKRLQLNDLLVAPIQHVTKYPLLLKDIRERTEDENERALLTTTIQTVENALNELDGKVKWLSNFERLRELQQLIQWPTMEEADSKMGLPDFLRDQVAKMSKNNLLASTKRTLLHEGPLNILENGKPTETYVFLFDDMILLTKQRKAQTHKKKSITSIPSENSPQPGTPVSRRKDAFIYIVHKPQLPLDRLDIMELDQQKATANGLKNAFVLIQMNRYQQVTAAYTLMSQEESTKSSWLSQLRGAKDKWMQMLRDERDNFQPSHRDAQRDRKRTL